LFIFRMIFGNDLALVITFWYIYTYG